MARPTGSTDRDRDIPRIKLRVSLDLQLPRQYSGIVNMIFNQITAWLQLVWPHPENEVEKEKIGSRVLSKCLVKCFVKSDNYN